MDRVSSPGSEAAPPKDRSSASEAFDELRQILFGQEKSKLSRLEQYHNDPVLHAEEVSGVLPQAVTRCVQRDERLADAMAPAVESALKRSVKHDPSIVTNAIFPVIGPAIRKALASFFDRLVQTFNHALEHSLSWRGLRWRMEAWRTGRPFAEVVLYHTLVFRVEQVFLIHRPTGLLLQHVVAPEVESSHEDVISGMLTAIQDFVRDSFRVGPGEELQAIRVGALDVWIESGPSAALAAVIRGQAPEEFRRTLVDTLEVIHRDEELTGASFTGDATYFQTFRPLLEECLKTQFVARSRRTISPQMLIVLGVLVLGAVGLGTVLWQQRARRQEFIAALQQEPGFVVTDTSHAHGKWRITGLKDPLARDPVQLAREAGLNVDKLEFNWQPYLGLNSELVLRRAMTRLNPPASVDMKIEAGTLIITGTAPEAWWRVAQSSALLLPGIDRVDGTGLRVEPANAADTGGDRAHVLTGELKNSILSFPHRQAEFTGQTVVVAAVAKAATELAQLARAQGAKVTLLITGHGDRSGFDEFDLALGRQRAESVRRRLIQMGAPQEMLATVGAGASESTTAAGPPFANSAVDGSVTFSVVWQR